MPFACALEMIHTYSLIHDDLPCMDDDDMRHGKPSNHKVYGYATALLAGDGLLTGAFGVAAANPYVDDKARACAVSLLSSYAGDRGMIGGQIMDLNGETEPMDLEQLLRLHKLKCGALIECASLLGCLAAGYEPQTPEGRAAAAYGAGIGLAFQVIDDLLDRYGNAEELGKNVGVDTTHNKTTFLTFFDREGAEQYAQTLTEEAISAVSSLKNSEILSELASYLLTRTH
jgi:geranylgeranyl diphosphate synthase type II